MEDCPACVDASTPESIPRWKAPLLFVGFLLFCPCHLPVTFAFVAALGAGLTGAAWLFANQVLVYAVFSAVYLVVLFYLFRWFVQRRDRERALDGIHAAHASQV